MQKMLPKLNPGSLLLIAGIVWMIAGGNILRMGLPDFIVNWQHNFLYVLGAIAVFIIFMRLIFYRLGKQTGYMLSSLKAYNLFCYYYSTLFSISD